MTNRFRPSHCLSPRLSISALSNEWCSIPVAAGCDLQSKQSKAKQGLEIQRRFVRSKNQLGNRIIKLKTRMKPHPYHREGKNRGAEFSALEYAEAVYAKALTTPDL